LGGLRINTGSLNKISVFVTMIKSYSAQIKSKNAYELAKLIASSSGILRELYNDKTPEGVSRYENIEELLNAIKDFSEKEPEITDETRETGELSVRTLDEFMQDIALLTDSDTNNKELTDYVSLMTIHSAKGLEFPYVYIVGLEENLFPSIQSLNSRADLEEERRLFYVALTRAEKHLTISYCESRYRWGNLIFCEPSRFIDEIKSEYLDEPVGKAFLKKESNLEKESSASAWKNNQGIQKNNLKKISNITNSGGVTSSETELFQTGMDVEHQRFGKGKIVNIEGTGSNKKATVFFQTVGQKQLLLKFAKLKILN